MDSISLIRPKKQRDSSKKEPLVLKLSSSGRQIIVCIGVFHTAFTFSSPQYKLVRSEWDAFIRYEGPKVALAEKPVPHILPDTLEDAVASFQEDGTLHWLARDAGIQSYCPEPDHAGVVRYLLKSFSPEDTVYAYIISTMEWRKKRTPLRTADEMVESGIRFWNRYADILGFTPTREWFLKKHAELFSDSDLEHDDVYRMIVSPFGDTVFNKIIAARSAYRDRILFETIEREWRSGKHIFVVYGEAHIYAIELALRALVAGK